MQSIAAGWRHTCEMTTSGDTYCWGDGGYGVLGDGGAIDRTFVPVPTDPF